MKKAIAFLLFFTLFTVFPAIITFAQNIQEGNATWYADSSKDLYASHARLPPGTMLRVTNLSNQKEVYVTVNNRIQNSDNRILDLSQAAATLLGMGKGSTPIRLVVERGSAPGATPAAAPKTAPKPAPKATVVSMDDFNRNNEDDFYKVGFSEVNYDDFYEYLPEDSLSEDPSLEDSSLIETDSEEEPPSPWQPESQAQPEQTAQSESDSEAKVLLKKIVVLIDGKEQTIDIPDGVYAQLSGGSATSASAYLPYYSSMSFYSPYMPPPPSTSAYQPYMMPPPSPPAYSPYPPSPPTPPPQPSLPPPPPPTPPPTRIYIPAPPPPTPTPPPPPPTRVYIPPMPPPAPPPVQFINPAIKIIPKLPDPNSGKVYRIQVGAFNRAALAQVCFDRLITAGFNPSYEQNGDLFRIVISGINAADVSYMTQRLNAAGFTEAWIREESQH